MKRVFKKSLWFYLLHWAKMEIRKNKLNWAEVGKKEKDYDQQSQHQQMNFKRCCLRWLIRECIKKEINKLMKWSMIKGRLCDSIEPGFRDFNSEKRKKIDSMKNMVINEVHFLINNSIKKESSVVEVILKFQTTMNTILNRVDWGVFGMLSSPIWFFAFL
jgi:hypothetical protein